MQIYKGAFKNAYYWVQNQCRRTIAKLTNYSGLTAFRHQRQARYQYIILCRWKYLKAKDRDVTFRLYT